MHLLYHSPITCRISIEKCSVDSLQHICMLYAAWVVGRVKHFTRYIVRIPAETPNAYVVDHLHIPAKTPTQVAK